MEQPKEAEVVVRQKPVDVMIVCPYCEHENVMDYTDFCYEYGNPHDWNYQQFICQKCGQTIEIQGQDWA